MDTFPSTPEEYEEQQEIFNAIAEEQQSHEPQPDQLTCSFFEFRQNNSGGRFNGPAVFVYVEASDLGTAHSKTEPHFTVCGDSGLYAEYDTCGCCPCCGHRWYDPWNDQGETVEEILETIDENGLEYMGVTAIALIKADGSFIKGDSDENLAAIRSYVSSANK